MAAVRMPRTQPHAVDAAIALFSRQGYERTTVEEIADAAQISRATFFRRYRSKEDVVFADHELLLEQVTRLLTTSGTGADGGAHAVDDAASPYLAVCRAARFVFDHHLNQRETSLARYRLLQQVPALRDRELVMTHRYERLFTRYLRDALPADEAGSVRSIAFVAGIVAVHNTFLRHWLRSPDLDLRPDLEEAFVELRRMATPDGAPSSSGTRPTTTAMHGARVVVVQVDADTSADAVADAVRDALA